MELLTISESDLDAIESSPFVADEKARQKQERTDAFRLQREELIRQAVLRASTDLDHQEGQLRASLLNGTDPAKATLSELRASNVMQQIANADADTANRLFEDAMLAGDPVVITAAGDA